MGDDKPPPNSTAVGDGSGKGVLVGSRVGVGGTVVALAAGVEVGIASSDWALFVWVAKKTMIRAITPTPSMMAIMSVGISQPMDLPDASVLVTEVAGICLSAGRVIAG